MERSKLKRKVAKPGKMSSNSQDLDQNHDHSQVQRHGFMLFLEWVAFTILLLPNILIAGFRKLCPPKGKSLNGRVVLVTGAGRGLGKELALGFAAEGCMVACVDINNETAMETAAEISRSGERAVAYSRNIASIENIKTLQEEVTKDLGPVDILVNNAGIVYNQSLEKTPDDAILAIANVNFLSHVWMVREFLPAMKSRNSGHIVAISSMSCHTSLVNASMYVATKWAVTGFMECLRRELQLQGHDIQVTTVCPTFMETLPLAGGYLTSRQKGVTKRPAEVAVQAIAAVRRNIFLVCIPEYLYYLCMLCKFLPTKMMDWGNELVVGDKMIEMKGATNHFDSIIRDTVHKASVRDNNNRTLTVAVSEK